MKYLDGFTYRVFKINKPYIVNEMGYNELVYFIRTTSKGFNFFSPSKNKTIFPRHFYDRKYSHKPSVPEKEEYCLYLSLYYNRRIKEYIDLYQGVQENCIKIRLNWGEFRKLKINDIYKCYNWNHAVQYPIGRIINLKEETFENSQVPQYYGYIKLTTLGKTVKKINKKEEQIKMDELGDRMKEYEGRESQRRFMRGIPIVARLDGKCFSSFTKGLKRPYDKRMSQLMVETTKALVEETNALIGYTQSDEISLIFYSNSPASQIYYDGRIMKMVGDMAAFATGVFNRLMPYYLPEKISSDTKKFPRFDCRTWEVPTKEEAVNAILWRELDATKNSISMAASSVYSHKELHKKNSSEKQDMLFQKGINWNDYPDFFKRGVFIQKTKVIRKFSAEEIEKIPEKHEARKNPDLEVERSEIRQIEMPPFSKVLNRVGVVFNGEDPKT